MTPHTFISKLNWRQVLIHFFGAWLIAQSFPLLTKLCSIKSYENLQIITGNDKEKIQLLLNNDFYNDAFFYFWFTEATWILGLLAAFIISLVIAKRKKWFWVNSLIVFILLFVLMRWKISGWGFLKYIFLAPGEIFRSNLLWLLTNGLVLLGLGLFVFYYKKFNDFIDGRKIAIGANAHS